MNELISIIIPVYKVEKYLNKCIDSIISQTYKNLEIILVDDGSPDNCPQICDDYAVKDERITVIHKANGGLSDARNAGIDICKGQFLMFIDSDDFIASDMIEKLYNSIENSDLCICNFQFADENGSIIVNKDFDCLDRKMLWRSQEFWDYYYMGVCIPCVVAWNKLYRKELFKNIRYDVGKRNEDEFIIDKIIRQCERITFIPDKLYMYRQRSGSIMSQLYTVKNLDFSEAEYQRSCRFIANKEYDLAVRSCTHYLKVLTDIALKLDMNVKENKIAYKKEKEKFKSLVYSLGLNKFGIMERIKVMLYLYLELFYIRIYELRNN